MQTFFTLAFFASSSMLVGLCSAVMRTWCSSDFFVARFGNKIVCCHFNLLSSLEHDLPAFTNDNYDDDGGRGGSGDDGHDEEGGNDDDTLQLGHLPPLMQET